MTKIWMWYSATWVLAIAVVLCAAVHVGAQAPTAQRPWAGIYTVTGVNPDGTTYTGVVEVVPWPGRPGLYGLTMVTGRQAMEIFAFADGDQLVMTALDGPMPIVVHADLEVRWAHPGGETIGSERWTRTDAKDLRELLPVTPAAVPSGSQVGFGGAETDAFGCSHHGEHDCGEVP